MKKMDQIIADYNSLNFESFMSEDEKWFFDTHGYIIVKNVLSKKNANYLIDKFEEWRSMPKKDLPAPMTISPNKNVFQNIHYVEKLYHDLIINDRIMKYVSSVLLHNPRLMFTSVIPPALEEITGTPFAMASKAERPKLSFSEGKRNKSE